MSVKTIQFRITGETILLHNGLLADPLNKWAKAMKVVSSKRSKTEADHLEMARLEWYGGLYLLGGKPVLPAEVIEATLVEGAKAKKLGKATKRALTVVKDAPLHFDGEGEWDGTEESVKAAWESNKYAHRAMVRVGMNKVPRTRPIFNNWSAEFVVEYESTRLNEAEVIEIVNLAGMNGICDWRPRHGRFTVEIIGA